MSQLLFDWLNNEVTLSRKIVSFSTDFKDGYMFGELLSKFNQQLNFHEFSAKVTPSAMLNNFCLLEPSMRKIGVHFNSRIATEIMAGKETATKNLLYEMKTALEGIYRINRQNTNQMLRGTVSDKAVAVIKPARKLYETTMSATYNAALGKTVENANAVMMENVLKHHTSKEALYLQTMSMADSDQYDAFMDSRYREKEINRHKKEQADEFARSWEAQNVAQWKVNQRVAHDRRNLKLKVEHDVSLQRERQRTKLLSATRKDTYDGLDEFSERLDASLLVSGTHNDADADSLIKTTTKVPGDKNLSLMYIDRATQKKGLDSAQKKMKEHHEDVVVRQQKHDQRRRKFIREYDTLQMKLSQKIFDTEVIAQLLNFAVSEQVEEDLMNKVISYKKIIPDNRHNRTELINAMAEDDFGRSVQWDAEEARREVEWTIGDARSAHTHRSEVLHTAVAAAERQISTDTALQVLDKVLDVVDWVVSCRQVGVFAYKVTEELPVFTAPLPETAPDPNAKKGGKEKEKKDAAPAALVEEHTGPVPSSCNAGDVVPVDIWADALKMFQADSSISKSFAIPSPLMVTDALWPYSLSERPACAEVDWLFQKPFRGADVLTELSTVPSSETAANGETSTSASEETVSVAPVKNLAESLSAADTSEFVEALNVAEIEVGLGETPDQPVVLVEPEPTEIDTLYTPSWITAVQPRHYLGEALVAVRCAVQPIPDEPAALVDTRHIPFRAALCGVSDLARKNLTEALVKQIPGLHVISATELVDRAFNAHVELLAGPVVDPDAERAVEPTAEEALNELTLTETAEATHIEPTEPGVSEGEVAAVVEVSGDAAPVSAIEEEPVPAGPPAVTFADLSKDVYEKLLAGATIPDELYVALIVFEIKQIPERNNGFLLQDFPSTKKQALLLMEAFSGINFDSRRPQPHDKVSSYAPPSPADVWTFDVKKSGLDMIIHVDNGAGILTSFEERARARTKDGEVIYISDDQTTIKGLQLIEDAARPFLAAGIDLTVADTATQELTTFCRQINLLHHFDFAQYASATDAVAEKAKELCDQFIPAENLLPGFLPNSEPVAPTEEPIAAIAEDVEEELLGVEGVEDIEGTERIGTASSGRPESVRSKRSEAADASPPINKLASKSGSRPPSRPATSEAAAPADPIVSRPATAASDAGRAPAEPDAAPVLNEDGTPVEDGEAPIAVEEKDKYIYQMPPVIFKPNAIPTPLAEALLQMWNTSESQSMCKSNTFFSSIRDVRYQMLQRRRAAFDGVSCLLVKLDDRQELYDNFRTKFNQVPSDLRFDPECVAELHLQTLELCDALLKISETRKQTAETYTKKIGADNVMSMLQHRTRCEAVAMAQSELQRFFVALHLLFDYTKSVRGYEMNVKILNELEVTLPVTVPDDGAGAKKDAKKETKKADKNAPAALVPFREPVGLVLVPKGSMEAVPEVNGGDEVVDPKAKKAPAKEKKGAVAENSDPFAEIETRILEEAAKWRKGNFIVTREVYEKDEPLCHALEQAIWYEAEKLVLSIANIKAILAKNVDWLSASEQELVHFMRDMVNQRYIKELAAINHLAEVIERSIDDAQPAPEMWLVSPDTLPVNPATVFADNEKFLPGAYRSPSLAQAAESEDRPVSATGEDLGKFKISPMNKKFLGKVNKLPGGKTAGFVPEASEHATDLQTGAPKTGTTKMERRPTLNANTTNHLRRGSVSHVPSESNVDEQYNKEMALFHAKRHQFEEKLLKHRAEREREFRSMGMSAATAKLAAYNELLLEEQHDMEDFDARHKPKRRPNSHVNRRISVSTSHQRRPTSAKAAVH